ncbi:MAG: TetR/AcrR family transcriptional regulator [Candidatus Krumholzibacteriaceae bacterium]|jgi:AcrR family transcriptional regulator
MSAKTGMGAGHVSRKERERLARQHEILLAARELFARNGFYDTTLDDIARHAEFGKGTIYNYFPSKEDLFFTIIDEVLDEIETIAEAAVGTSKGGAREKLSAYARDIVSFCREHSDLIRVISREVPHIDSREQRARVAGIKRRGERTLKTLARPIAEDARAGKLRQLDAEEVATLFSGALHFYLMHRMSEQGSFDSAGLDEGMSLLVTVFFDGLERK